MITAKKIRTLKPRVQLRKAADVFHEAKAQGYGEDYLQEVLSIALSSELLSDGERARLRGFYDKGDALSYEDIYYCLLNALGESPADWDRVDSSGNIDWESRTVLRHSLFLDHIRSPYNVGSVFRSAEAFGVERIYLAPGTASPLHQRAVRTSRGAVEGIAWEERELSDLPPVPVFALETGGTPLSEFAFPEEGICILGSEETGVSKEGRELASSSLGIVSIPQLGAKGSVNVSAACAVLLYQWMLSSSPGSTCKGP